MGDSGPRYGFSPLERRGVLLGLQPVQLAGAGAALVVGLVVRSLLGGAVGSGVAFLIAGAGLAAAVCPIDGQPAGAVVWTGLGWLARRAAGPRLNPAPLSGHSTAVAGNVLARSAVDPSAVDPSAVDPSAVDPGTAVRSGGREAQPARSAGGAGRSQVLTSGPARGVVLLTDRGGPGELEVGVVQDRPAGTWAAVLPVGGRSFNLLDPAQQASCLEAWRSVLGTAARSGTPVVRLQWLQRRGVTGPRPGVPDPAAGPPMTGAAVDGYAQLVDETRSATCGPDSWLVVAVRTTPSRSGSGGRRPVARAGERRNGEWRIGERRLPPTGQLRRELRLLDGQLRAAGLEPGAPLDRAGLADLLSASYVAPGGTLSTGRAPGADGAPLAVEEGWATVRVDGGWHCTYWVAEWPRVEVGPDFLAPLLVGAGRRRVSVVMAPVPAERALREVRSARTADLADAELRSRAGFLSSARRDKEALGVNRREEELADGHSEYRFSGYVTVSADDPDNLAVACSEVEQAAQSARLELRRLWGRQAESYTWTLPLARGLR